MTKQMKVSYDGIGIINNRGVSKYWGVTNYNACSHTDWRIQLNSNGEANTFHFDGCNPKEEVAASIIAKFYDLRDTGIKNISYVKASDGLWYKVDPISRKVRKMVGSQNIPKGMIKELPEQFRPSQNVLNFPTPSQTATMLSDYEMNLATSIIDGFKNDRLSKQGIELMNRIIGVIKS